MIDMPRLHSREWLILALVLALAGAVRGWYVYACANAGQTTGPLIVQGDAWRAAQAGPLPAPKLGTTYHNLVPNMIDHRWFGSAAPLAVEEETTAHVAPGYFWLAAFLARFDPAPEAALRWLQVFFGVATVWCYFLFARRAFANSLVAVLAGLFTALHPFWIINTAELTDGVLASFLVAAVLATGTRASQMGGPFTSFLYGLTLAALALVRAALLPFTLVALVWFLFRCRTLKLGWFRGLLAFLGFANGLAPWTVRNFQAFGEPVPIVTSTYLHLYMGNNPSATGAALDETTLRNSLSPEKVQRLLAEPNQAERYSLLGLEVFDYMAVDPAGSLGRRLDAGLMFLTGESWFTAHKTLSQRVEGNEAAAVDLADHGEVALRAALLALLILGALGWRLSYGWRRQSRLATLAVVWIPLPYLLSHAEALSGPRLPLDGVLCCFAAYAVACLNPTTPHEPDA